MRDRGGGGGVVALLEAGACLVAELGGELDEQLPRSRLDLDGEAGVPDLRPAGTLSFSGFEQIIPAAVAGNGVALGRTPLVKDLLAARELVAPFKTTADPARAYFAIIAPSAQGRPEVDDFVSWLREEAAKR